MHRSDLFVMLAFTNVVLFSTTITFVTLWIRARERAIRARVEAKEELEGRKPEHLDHLVNAVDAIAVEVERISEAQRFTTKVLIDRENAGSPKRVPERVVTPH
jgi:hypothetical protein